MGKFNEENSGNIFLSYIVRLLLVAVVLTATSFLTPGFSIQGIWSIIIAAIVIMAIDYAVELLMGVDASPFGKGIKGFVIAAIIIYITQYLVPNMNVTVVGALLAALVIGIIDAVIPSRIM